jgi:hypothetical protein
MARRFEESGLSRDQATGMAEATSDEIGASLPSKADIDLAIERIKGGCFRRFTQPNDVWLIRYPDT